ncbi:MAG: 16S rRNA (uracil(1498)-N(3))-methyltransferase [Candidatus Polarisedimenticolia bacterium]
MSERRFLVDPADVDTESAMAWVRGDEHRHLTRVLRLRPGDEVSVFDGSGSGHHGRVDVIEPAATRVRLTGTDDRRVEPSFRLTLAQGIPHHERMEWLIQKTTELGVSRIVPVLAARSVPRSPGGRWERLERWRRVAAEATRQCGRRSIPEVAEPRSLAAVLREHPARPDLWRTILLEQEAGAPGFERPTGRREGLVIVGPEGGWDPAEVREALAAGVAPVYLGPRVLRAETAGVISVAITMFLAGEMDGS